MPLTSPTLRISADRPADAFLVAPAVSSHARLGHPTGQTATVSSPPSVSEPGSFSIAALLHQRQFRPEDVGSRSAVAMQNPFSQRSCRGVCYRFAGDDHGDFPGDAPSTPRFAVKGLQANVDAWQIRCGASSWFGVGRVPYRVVRRCADQSDRCLSGQGDFAVVSRRRVRFACCVTYVRRLGSRPPSTTQGLMKTFFRWQT